MKRRTVLVLTMAVICLGLPQRVFADLTFDNGGINDINYNIPVDVEVLDSSLGSPTTLNLLSGGETGEIDVYNSSIVNVFDGLIRHNLDAHDSSIVKVYGGTVGAGLVAYDSSQVTVSGGLIDLSLLAMNNSQVTVLYGLIDESLHADNDSYVTINGGMIGEHLQASGNSVVNITGGIIGSFAETNGGGQITISGGSIGGVLWAGDSTGSDHGIMTIMGDYFAINGNPVAFGQYFASDYASGHLTGILADGSLLDNDFLLGGNSKIELVYTEVIPVPSAMLLAALGLTFSGGLLSRRRG